MKSTGMIRRVDELGRIVIPKEMRDMFNIVEKDLMEIFIDGDNIILRKYEESCIFCGNTKNLVTYKNKLICNKCKNSIHKIETAK